MKENEKKKEEKNNVQPPPPAPLPPFPSNLTPSIVLIILWYKMIVVAITKFNIIRG